MATKKNLTPNKRRKIKGGKGMMNGNETGVPFSSTNQPSAESKKKGWLTRKRGQELAKAITELAFKGKTNSRLKKQAAQYFGVNEDEITVEVMMIFKQAEKAIQKGDTHAFNAIMDRTFGKPKQENTVNVKDLSKLPIIFE